MNLRSIAVVRPQASVQGRPEKSAATKMSREAISQAPDPAPSKASDTKMFRASSGLSSRPSSFHQEGRMPALGLDRTLRSLIATSQLGDSRVSQVQTRMRDGYYARPEVTRVIAGTLGKILAMDA